MSEQSDSVSHWFSRARQCDENAAHRLWMRFAPKLIRVARRKVPEALRRVSDEEDLALRAFESLIRRARLGEFDTVQSRSDLWALLVVILDRQARSQIRDELRLKRGAGLVQGESAVQADAFPREEESTGLEGVAAATESPSQVIVREEWFAEVLASLDDKELSQIVCYKCDGYSNEEIGQRIGRSLATVERRLRLIRTKLTALGQKS